MRLSAFLVLLAVAACDGATELVEAPIAPPPPPPPSAPPPAVVEISATTFFAGAPFTLTSAAFSVPGVVPQLTIEGVAVPLERIAGTVFRGELPRTLSGTHDPVLQVGGQPAELPSIAVHGFTGSQSYPSVSTGFSSDEAIAFGSPGVATVMTDQAAGLSLIDLDAGTVTVHPDLHAKGMYLPGPTYDPDVWLLRPNDPGPLEAWNLAGPAPVLLPGKAPGWGQNRAVALLDSTHMIFFGGNTGNSWRMDQGGSWTVVSPYRIEGDKQMRFSPDGTRLVTTTSGLGVVDQNMPTQQNGVFVWSVPNGEVAYLLPNSRDLRSAGFSPDGSRLATVVARIGEPIESTYLQIVNAQNGALLHSATFGTPLLSVAYDPFRPLIYLASKAGTSTVELTVISATTFQVVGRMQGPCSTTCLLDSPIVVSAANAVYFFDNGAHLAVRFSLPPVGP
ncbi:MAG: hypothetical protein U0974_12905 [Gemmatimonadales bacterium]|nr:hypothetical protein [Gemmatimonadales bacterium]